MTNTQQLEQPIEYDVPESTIYLSGADMMHCAMVSL